MFVPIVKFVSKSFIFSKILFAKLHSSRDRGNNFRFPNIASHTGRFCLILVCISSVISFRVGTRQLFLFLICRLNSFSSFQFYVSFPGSDYSLSMILFYQSFPLCIVSYVHFSMSYKDLHAKINHYLNSKI